MVHDVGGLLKNIKIVKNNIFCLSIVLIVLICSLTDPMNAKKVNISISMPEYLRSQVRQAAFDDNRSVSNLVCSLLRSHLRREGYPVRVNGSEAFDAGVARPRQARIKYR